MADQPPRPVRGRCLAALLLAIAACASAAAQTGLPGLLRDIAPSPSPLAAPLLTAPVVFVNLGGEIYFASWDLTDGVELRASDGTAAGTRTVRDACPGSCSGFYGLELVESGGVLYFVGDDPVHGRELWRSDGTRAGTYRVSEIIPGGNHGPSPGFLTPAPGGLYFVAWDADHGEEIWWSDGTTAGTRLVADVRPGPAPGVGDGPSHLTWLAGHGLLFATDDGLHGREPWITQGTAATTTMLADTRPGAASGLTYYQPYPLPFYMPQVAGGKVFFAADDGVHGNEPWVSDGTPARTAMVADVVTGSAGSEPYGYFALGSDVLFGAGEPGWPRTLWRSDGTAAGTVALGDAAHGSERLNPFAFAELDGTVYFPGYQTATGRELWATDGTLAGTHLALEVQPGAGNGVVALYGFGAGAGRLWFHGDDGVHGAEWWQSDGTTGGTFQVADLTPGAQGSVDPWSTPRPAAIGSHVLFTAFDPARTWAVRAGEPGTAGSVVLEAAGDRAGSLPFCVLSNCPSTMTPVPGGVAFAAVDAVHGLEPWRSDGTEAGTHLVADIAAGTWPGVFPYQTMNNRAALGNDLLLIATDCTDPSGCDGEDYQLWRATPEGTTTRLTDEPWAAAPTGLASWNGAGYLGAANGLWRTDGTAAGTAPIGGGAFPRWLTPGRGALYFSAADLWRTDGTPAGTMPLGGGAHSVSARPVLTNDGAGNDLLYFPASDAASGNELWRSDGTNAGTWRVVDLRAGVAAGIPQLMLPGLEEQPVVAAAAGKAFFAGDDGFAGEELWISDGTPGNATLLEVRPGPQGSRPRWLTAVGSRVYFVADDGIHGAEPWVSDGTPAGTHLLADVRPGPESSSARELVGWMGRLVFAADDDVHGMELWRAGAGGTSAELVTDLRPGIEPSSPQGLTAVGERLYFFADDGTTGLEPWVWSAAADMFRDGFETGDVARWSRVTPF